LNREDEVSRIFNYSVSTAKVTHGNLIMNNGKVRTWKEGSWPLSVFYPGIYLKRLRKTTIHLSG
jgi:hypothetical protein